MSETVYIIMNSFKRFFALSENKTYKRQRWYLTKEYFHPVDFYENDCFYKIPEDSKENFLLKLKCGIEAAKLGVKEGVLSGIFLGGFWGLLSEFSDFDYIGFAFGLSEKTKDTDDEKMEIELSSQCYTLIKSSEYGKQNSISTEQISLFSDISKNIINKNIKNDHEKINPLENKIQESIRNSPGSKPYDMSKEKSSLNQARLSDETKIILESIDPGRGNFYNNSGFGFKKGRKNVQIVGCALIETGGSMKSLSSDSSSDTNDTADEIFFKKKAKSKHSEVKAYASDEGQAEDKISTNLELDDDKHDDYKSFILRNLPEDFEYDDSVDQAKLDGTEFMFLPLLRQEIKETTQTKQFKKNRTPLKSDSHSSKIPNIDHTQKKGIKKKFPYFVKADHLANGFDSDQNINNPVVAYQVKERVTRPSDSDLFLQEIKKLRENLEVENQSSSEHSTISSSSNSEIHPTEGHRNEFRDNKKSSNFSRKKKEESKVILNFDEMKKFSQEEFVDINEKTSAEPEIVPVPKQRRYKSFDTSESKPEQRISTSSSSQKTETKDIPLPKQTKFHVPFVTSTPKSSASIETDPTTQRSRSEIKSELKEEESIPKFQSTKSVAISEPLDAPTYKSQDPQPSPEKKLIFTPTAQNVKTKVIPTPSERKSVAFASQSPRSGTISEPLDAPTYKSQDPQPSPEKKLIFTTTAQNVETKVTPTPSERKSVAFRSQSPRSGTVSEPLDAPTYKSQDPQPSPEKKLIFTPTAQNVETKVTPTPSERKSVTFTSQSPRSGTVSEPLDAPTYKSQDPQPSPEKKLIFTTTAQNVETKVTPTPSERKSVASTSQSPRSGTVSEPLDAPTYKSQDPQPSPEKKLIFTPTAQNVETKKVTPTLSDRKSVAFRSRSSRSGTVSEPPDAPTYKYQDPKPSAEKKLIFTPTAQNVETKVTLNERKSILSKSESPEPITVSEPLVSPENKSQDSQSLPEERFFITPTAQDQKPKVIPIPCDRKSVISLSQTSKSVRVATPSVAPISKVTKTEKKELKEGHECIRTNHSNISIINQNLIFLYACNCAIVLGVICCGLSVFKASLI